MALSSICLGVLGWALGLNALAAPDALIPLDQLGAVAGQQYHGDGLGVSATPEGAQLRCVFQRLTGRVTPEGLWLGFRIFRFAETRQVEFAVVSKV